MARLSVTCAALAGALLLGPALAATDGVKAVDHLTPDMVDDIWSMYPQRANTSGPDFAYSSHDIDVASASIANKFWGIGGLSGGGSTTRLLVDYPEPARSEILDLLFKPNYAASLHLLKVEIGGDSQSTDGTETSHMHSEDDLNFERGYEWWLMKEAKKRNPDIKLYGLAWAFPGWVGNGTGSPFSHPDLTSHYITEWIKGARDVYNLTIDYVGIWNERSSDATYVQSLKKMLTTNGFGDTLIVAKDGSADICDDMAKDPAYAAAVDIIGLHYPSDYKNYSTCLALNKPFWASEESSSYDDLNGAACWGRIITSHWVLAKITSSIMWNLVGSYYHGTNWYASSMLTAVQPWSGFYGDDIDGSIPVVWATAHVTQFTDVGWMYLDNGAGSGELANGGFMATLVSPDQKEVTITIAKISYEHAPCTRPKLPSFSTSAENVTFTFKPGTAPATLNYYYSNYEVAEPVLFKEMAPIAITGNTFTLMVPVGSFITLSTRKGTKPTLPARSESSPAFPLPHADDFQKYTGSPYGTFDSSEAMYFTDQIGAFEIHPEEKGSANWVMQQMVPALPIGWGDPGTFGPMSQLGMREWQDIEIGVSFKLPVDAPSIASGCVATRVDQMWHMGIVFCVEASGSWTLALGGPKLGTNQFTKTYATGTVEAKAGAWHTISLTTTEDQASGTFDGKSVFSAVAIRDDDTGFGAIGGSHWLPTQYDAFSVKQASGTKRLWANKEIEAPTAPAAAGAAICTKPCARNGLMVDTQTFDILSSYAIKHKASGLCVTANDDKSLSLAACVHESSAQNMQYDYTRIRNMAAKVTHMPDGATDPEDFELLLGNDDGSVFLGAYYTKASYTNWAYFPNTKQLRNQYTAGINAPHGYPRCLSTC